MSNLDQLPQILDFIQVSVEEFETAYISRASFDALRAELAAARKRIEELEAIREGWLDNAEEQGHRIAKLEMENLRLRGYLEKTRLTGELPEPPSPEA